MRAAGCRRRAERWWASSWWAEDTAPRPWRPASTPRPTGSSSSGRTENSVMWTVIWMWIEFDDKNLLEKVWESVRKDFCEHNLMKRKYFLCVLEAASQGLWRKFGEFRVSCSWFKAFMKLKEKLFMKIIRGKGCLWCKESCLWWEFKQKIARTRQELLMNKIRGKQG